VIRAASEEPPTVCLKELYQVSALHFLSSSQVYYTHKMRICQAFSEKQFNKILELQRYGGVALCIF